MGMTRIGQNAPIVMTTQSKVPQPTHMQDVPTDQSANFVIKRHTVQGYP